MPMHVSPEEQLLQVLYRPKIVNIPVGKDIMVQKPKWSMNSPSTGILETERYLFTAHKRIESSQLLIGPV